MKKPTCGDLGYGKPCEFFEKVGMCPLARMVQGRMLYCDFVPPVPHPESQSSDHPACAAMAEVLRLQAEVKSAAFVLLGANKELERLHKFEAAVMLKRKNDQELHWYDLIDD